MSAPVERGVAPLADHAVATTIDRWGASVFGLVLRVTRNVEVAEGICEDSFLQRWRQAEVEPARSRSTGCVRTLAHRSAVDWVRRQGVADGSATRLVTAPELPTDPEGVEDPSDEAAAVRAALGQVPIEQREAICLSFFDGLSEADVATATGVPLETVRRRVRDGMLLLGALLNDLAAPGS